MIIKRKSLVTLNITYYRLDYRSILQEFIWQTMDVKPKYPRVQKFLNYWHNNIDAIINEIQQPEHDNIYKVNDLLLTDDHPLFNTNNELVSIEPELSLERYELESKQLKVGDKLKTIDNSDFEVMSIERY